MQITKHWQPDDLSFIEDPFIHYEALRKESSVFNSPSGDYVLLSYQDVRKVLMDKSFLVGVRTQWMEKTVEYAKKKGRDYSTILLSMQAMLLQINPPMHADLRTFLSKNWPKKDELASISDEIVSELISTLPEKGNLVDTLSRRLPLLVINRVLGTNHFQSNQYIEDGIQILRTMDPYLTVKDLERINESATRLYESFSAFYDEIAPGDLNLSTKIKGFHQQGTVLFEPVSLLIFLFISGMETTSSLISSIVLILLKEKELQKKLDSQRALENFVYESLRLHSPVQLTGRTNPSDTIIGNLKVPANSTITLCIGAANRDPNQFTNPHEIDLERDQHNQLGFGYGIHHCLGNQMALTEATALVKNILPLISSLQLIEDPVYNSNLALRNILSLHVIKNGAQKSS